MLCYCTNVADISAMLINGSRKIWQEPKFKKYGIAFLTVSYVPIHCVICFFSSEEEFTLTRTLSFSSRHHIGVMVLDCGMRVRDGWMRIRRRGWKRELRLTRYLGSRV